jgi:hypothetical protein
MQSSLTANDGSWAAISCSAVHVGRIGSTSGAGGLRRLVSSSMLCARLSASLTRGRKSLCSALVAWAGQSTDKDVSAPSCVMKAFCQIPPSGSLPMVRVRVLNGDCFRLLT